MNQISQQKKEVFISAVLKLSVTGNNLDECCNDAVRAVRSGAAGIHLQVDSKESITPADDESVLKLYQTAITRIRKAASNSTNLPIISCRSLGEV